jgi:hypothetical protein
MIGRGAFKPFAISGLRQKQTFHHFREGPRADIALGKRIFC